jgi:hypothetical protein
MYLTQKVDQRFIVVGARTQLKAEVTRGCPGGSYRRQQRHAGLVFEQDQCALVPGHQLTIVVHTNLYLAADPKAPAEELAHVAPPISATRCWWRMTSCRGWAGR